MAELRYPLARPYFSESSRNAICEDIDSILASGRLMLGPYARKLEQGMAEAIGVPHAVSVNSCTTALTIALQYYGVQGGEVLVPSGSFVTDVSAVLFAGAEPVLVDMNPENLSFDLKDLARKISDKTKAIIWVHLTGVISPEYRQILDIASAAGLPVIEDAAQAHGSTAEGAVAGSIGDVGCFSFYPTKVMTCGSGGLLTTRDAELKRYAEEMRLFGKDADTGDVKNLGNDWFLDEIRACIAYHQYLELPGMVERRRSLAATYELNLLNQPGIRLLADTEGFEPSYYQYAVFLDDRIDSQRLRNQLREKHGIESKPIYKPTHHESVFRRYDTGDLLGTTQALTRSLCLPLHAGMTDEDAEHIARCLVSEVRGQE
jgi:dTDP-4-amino-4,6-dideoxygalactose transaminase